MESLDAVQREVLACVTLGKNVLFLGQAGCGKSHLLRVVQGLYGGLVMAPTSIAAQHIGGRTIHSAFHLNYSTPLNFASGYDAGRRGDLGTDLLIMDEVSMISQELWDYVNGFCQGMRGSQSGAVWGSPGPDHGRL